MVKTRQQSMEERNELVGSKNVERSRSVSVSETSSSAESSNEFSEKFELLEEIGSGSFGSVYRGIERATGKEVAVKLEKRRPGRPSSLAAEIRYYEKLFEFSSQDMRELEHLNNGSIPIHGLEEQNVTMYHDEASDVGMDSIERSSMSGQSDEVRTTTPTAVESNGNEDKDDGNGNVSRMSIGIPKLIFSGIFGKRYVIVMEMLGSNLEKLFNECNRRFSLKTVTQIALQLLDRIQFIHSKGILHRDIKPENFVIGRRNEEDIKIRNTLHVVDFGLSKFFLNQDTGIHNPHVTGKELTGTARYVSLRTHNGEEQSRRDDIEAIGHMLIYFMRGSLPWQGLKMATQPGMDQRALNKLRYKKIEKRKKSISLQELCSGIPCEFQHFLSYGRYVMGYMDEPDYEYLKQLFIDLKEKHEYPDDHIYDWDCLNHETNHDLGLKNFQSLSNIKVRGSDANEQKI